MENKNNRGRPNKGVSRLVFSIDDGILSTLQAQHDGKYGFLSRKINELLHFALMTQPLEKPVKTGKLRK